MPQPSVQTVHRELVAAAVLRVRAEQDLAAAAAAWERAGEDAGRRRTLAAEAYRHASLAFEQAALGVSLTEVLSGLHRLRRWSDRRLRRHWRALLAEHEALERTWSARVRESQPPAQGHPAAC